MTRVLLATLLLIAPLAAGCLSDEPAPEAPAAAGSAADAGQRAGEAPVAPKEAYAAEGGATAHPIALSSNAARAPVVVDFSGEFKPGDCRPFHVGDLEGVLGTASDPRRFLRLDDVLQVGDVFRYNVTLTYTNAPDNWAEIHMEYGLGSTSQGDDASTQGMTDVVISFEGQGYRASEDDMAYLFVICAYGVMSRPIPYTYTAAFTFAEGAIPAEAPVLLDVPEGATKLFVRGVPIDPAEGVQSHFRIFRPDDTLLCECGLGSSETETAIDLPGPGAYVLLVDHTSNGFVSAALDVPDAPAMRALAAEWVRTTVLAKDGGAVDETVEFHLDRVPLFMTARVIDKDGVGLGKHTMLSITNDRGEPLRISWGGHLTWEDPVGGRAWTGFWPADWEYVSDHHAYAQGHHSAHVSAEELRGEVELVTRHYVR